LAILLDNNLSIWNIRLIIAYLRPGAGEPGDPGGLGGP